MTSPPFSSQGERGISIQESPEHPSTYAFLIDVAGQDEAAGQQVEEAVQLTLEGLGNPGRDSTTLSIVEVDLSTLPTLQAPSYRVVRREAWQGLDHVSIFGKLKALAEAWNPLYIVIDATGVGEGLWSMLHRLHPTRTLPVKFTQQSKSEIGWKFLAIIETGRFQSLVDTEEVRNQYRHCRSEVLPGPARTLRWGVKDGTRGPDGALVHDDFVLADSLVALLDTQKWTVSTRPAFHSEPGIFDELREKFGQDI
jgi:Terminase RNaseH-like domain